MARMTKRWTRFTNAHIDAVPETVADKLKKYPKPTGRQRKLIARAVHEAIGRAMEQHGAARNSAMRKLAGLPLDNIVDEATLTVLRDPKWQPKPKAKKEPVHE